MYHALCPYLRTPERNGALPTAAELDAAGLVFRQVGTTFVAPNLDGGRVYAPIDGAVTVPIRDRDIPLPGCARAAVLERANTVATIIVNFMAGSFLIVR